MKNSKKLFHFTVMILASGLLAAACTKKLPYKQELKEQVDTKSSIDTESVHLYVPTISSISRTNSDTIPYWVGTQKLVKLRWTEKELQVYEIDSDERFKDNPANNKVVFAIPVEHLDYKCTEDRYGQCTNKEEKNTEISWQAKGQFKPDFSNMKISEANILPIEVAKLFGSNCYTESGIRPLSYKFEKDFLNIEIEKTYRVDVSCIKNYSSLSEFLQKGTATAIFHYSIGKLDKLATKNYQALNYSEAEKRVFGYFDTENIKLDVDNNLTNQSRFSYVNRWSPNREKIDFVLSPEFSKAENSALLKATKQAFQVVNTGLESAGVAFRLNAIENKGEKIGDLRHNHLVMVEDPILTPILGYAPRSSNPLTGEIINSRIVMYSGVMKQYTRWTYDELARKIQAKNKIADKNTVSSIVDKQVEQNWLVKTGSIVDQVLNRATNGEGNGAAQTPAAASGTTAPSAQSNGRDLISNNSADANSPISVMTKYCTYPADYMNFSEQAETELKQKFGNELKAWDELSDAEKKYVVDLIIPQVWVTTLVHEIGHTLGLRHNFAGSQDKANFYSGDELKAMNINHPIPYSSVMDYPYTRLNQMASLGKYDIAALRYAYRQELETTDRQLIITKSLNLAEIRKEKGSNSIRLKNYLFCTDEQVELNAGCKPFDEGTTYTEMAQHEIKNYFLNRESKNFRSGRGNFSLNDDHLYANRIWRSFNNLRMYLLKMGRIRNLNPRGNGFTSNIYKNEAVLVDLKNAALIAGRFFIEILRTPDVTCLVNTDKSQTIRSIPLIHLSATAMNCDQSLMRPGFKFIEQIGFHLNSIRDPESVNPYEDQIDVRGIWIDKILASIALGDRKFGKVNSDPTDNYFDLPDLADELEQLLLSLARGKISYHYSPEVLKANGIADASHALPKLVVDLGESLEILKSPSDEVQKRFSLPERNFLFAEWFFRYLKRELNNTAQVGGNGELFDLSISLNKVPLTTPVQKVDAAGKPLNIVTETVNDFQFVGHTNRNHIATSILQEFSMVSVFKSRPPRPEKLSEIMNAKEHMQSVSPEGLSPVEEYITNLPLAYIKPIVNTETSTPYYLQRILEVMAK